MSDVIVFPGGRPPSGDDEPLAQLDDFFQGAQLRIKFEHLRALQDRAGALTPNGDDDDTSELYALLDMMRAITADLQNHVVYSLEVTAGHD